jgi:hypothetical protein
MHKVILLCFLSFIGFKKLHAMERIMTHEQAKKIVTTIRSIPIAEPKPSSSGGASVGCIMFEWPGPENLDTIKSVIAQTKADFLKKIDPIKLIADLEFMWRQKADINFPGYVFTMPLVKAYRDEQNNFVKEFLALYIIAHYSLPLQEDPTYAKPLWIDEAKPLLIAIKTFLHATMGWSESEVDSFFNTAPSETDKNFMHHFGITCR